MMKMLCGYGSLIFISMAVVLAVFPGTAVALDVNVSPASIDWQTNTWVNIVVSNAVNGVEVALNLFADIDGDGQIDAEDMLFFRVELEDGRTNAIPSEILPDDDDGTVNGVIPTRISYHGVPGALHAIGSYIWQAVDANNGETNTVPFAVTQQPGPVWVTGEVQNFVPPHAAIVPALVEMCFLSDHWEPLAWCDTNGAFKLYLPDGVSTAGVEEVTAFAPAYISAESGPNDEPFSSFFFTNCLSAGENALQDPLFVVAEFSNVVYSVSGHTYVKNGDETNALAGALVFFEQDAEDEGFFVFDISGFDGSYKLPIPSNEVGFVFSADYLLNMRGIAGTGEDLPAVSGDVTGLDLLLQPADALARAQVTNNLTGAPVAGVGIEFEHDEYYATSYTLDTGFYELWLMGASNYTAAIEEEEFLPRMGYVESDEEHTGLNIASGTVFTGAPFGLDKGYLLSGHIYDTGTNGLAGGTVGANPTNDWQWVASSDTDLNGYYELLLLPGCYRVSTWGFEGYVNAETNNVELTVSGLSGVDLYLHTAGIIEGQVLGDGSQLDNAHVGAGLLRTNEWGSIWLEHFGGDNTDADGMYSISVASGSYVVRAYPPDGSSYLRQYYDMTNELDGATQVAVTLGTPVTNINFNLQEGVEISGQVLGAGLPLADAWVDVEIIVSNESGGVQWTWVDSKRTDSNGNFSMYVEGGSNYMAVARGPDDGFWVKQYYQNEGWWEDATLFLVAPGAPRTDINFDLITGMRVTGRVTNEVGAAMVDVWVGAEISGGGPTVEWTSTVEDGCYAMALDPANTYVFEARSEAENYGWIYYDGKWSRETADVVTGIAGETIAGIDFQLLPTGSVEGGIYPAELQGSAWWRLTTGPYTGWYGHASIVQSIPAGIRTQTFSEAWGWITPEDRIVTVVAGDTTIANGIYSKPVSIEFTKWLSANSMTFGFAVSNGWHYYLQQTPSLLPQTWTGVPPHTNIVDEGRVIITNTIPPDVDSVFYRLNRTRD